MIDAVPTLLLFNLLGKKGQQEFSHDKVNL